MSDAVLRARNLVVERGGRDVLHGVSLEVRPGAITALLGANGAGKSSVILTLVGLLAARAGAMMLDGRDIIGERPDRIRRRGVTAVLEGHRVLGTLSVLDNLKVAASALAAAPARAEVDKALRLLPELQAHLGTAAANLSGGQKQMVAIAQALIGRPRFLLVDELSLGLAPTVVVRLGVVLREVAEAGVGVLLVEQFTTLALTLATQAYVLERGRLVFEGPSEALRDDPSILHAAYLAARPAPASS